MYVRFGKRICDIIIGLVALPFVLLIIAVLCVVWPYVSDHLKAKKSAKAPAAAQNIGEDINDD